MGSQARRAHRILFRLKDFNFLYSWSPHEELFAVDPNSKDKRLIKRPFLFAEWNGPSAVLFQIPPRENV